MRKNNKSMEEIREITARLESVVKELQEIGCYGSINIGCSWENQNIEILMNNEDLPTGKARYEKTDSDNKFILKKVNVNNVEFHTYITKKEAEKELFA